MVISLGLMVLKGEKNSFPVYEGEIVKFEKGELEVLESKTVDLSNNSTKTFSDVSGSFPYLLMNFEISPILDEEFQLSFYKGICMLSLFSFYGQQNVYLKANCLNS